ncbi:sel1 repeat family protein [Campylobacter lari]|uniref:tetratricopeptide repeat protein n=1 Tax=Campylobacter lari TaxID=201 RepID=UPI00127778E4|nr:tetratricopeptide repeat protein [Campylobacter lari]EAJ0341835.1 sel1 repeat family protein [Campylobacter lari]EAJ0342498.1 sel1 repeat family protein [Campylobacter lari]EAL3889162.1 sel1 repeat family protein [Campylobacter lari]EAL3889808.1 sel1 repeat family protein [Campylobacter lari]EGK8105579.1 sel1 repeat family protein [Campylobacter lari]
MKKVLIILAILFLNFAYSQEDLFVKGFKAYESGDYINAIKYYKQACDLNNGDGCSNLGFMYANGQGVKKDNFKAVELYVKACNLNDGAGCSNLGVMYALGKGVRKDTSKALEYFGKACDLKNDLGCQAYAKLKQ